MQLKWTVVLVACVAACGSKHDGNGDKDAGTGDAGMPTVDAFTGPYSDFPGTIIDTGTPAGAAALFGAPGTGSATGGPCLVEPEVGTLYPQNWLRPRFTWVATGTENLFELTISAANETTPLVVYTTATTWTMPADIWGLLAAHIIDAPITVGVRGATSSGAALTSGPEIGSVGDISIAPAQAGGAIVYWTTSDNTALKGFHIGDESVSPILVPSDNGPTTLCVGCHSSTPDGKYVGFSASTAAGDGDPAMLGLRSSDGMFTAPPFLTASASALMSRTFQEAPVFSAMHWKDGDHTAVTMFANGGKEQIIWTDLEATAQTQGTGWDVVSRGAETTTASSASFAHTSDTLLYTSGVAESSGVTTTNGDLETLPFNDRAGGTPTPIPGASTPDFNEYYGTWSPDDKYIAFNRVPANMTSYNDAAAEVFAIPAAGGTPVRLVANDPPTCSGATSPGVTNSWPKWAPDTTDAGNGKRYYWLTFSSDRLSKGHPQLYVTGVVDDGMTLTTYPALYLWNQPAAENNHTPAWDNFQIPIQ